MDDELEYVCEKCVHYEVCDRSSRMIWARLSKEKVCTDFMEVVRCKDCDWYREDGSICVNPKCTKSWYGCRVPEQHFCSYGERKDNDV